MVSEDEFKLLQFIAFLCKRAPRFCPSLLLFFIVGQLVMLWLLLRTLIRVRSTSTSVMLRNLGAWGDSVRIPRPWLTLTADSRYPQLSYSIIAKLTADKAPSLTLAPSRSHLQHHL